jgi:hypothetical protein
MMASAFTEASVCLALSGRVCDNVAQWALRKALDGRSGAWSIVYNGGGCGVGFQIDEERRTMKDERDEILAEQLLSYSLDLQPGERFLVEVCGREALELAKVVVRQATAKGAVPFWRYNDPSLQRQWIGHATEA